MFGLLNHSERVTSSRRSLRDIDYERVTPTVRVFLVTSEL